MNNPTELAIIGAALIGAYKSIDGLIMLIKYLVTKNGKPGNSSKLPGQAAIEVQVLAALDKKVDSNVCELTHKYITENLTELKSTTGETRDTVVAIEALIKTRECLVKRGD